MKHTRTIAVIAAASALGIVLTAGSCEGADNSQSRGQQLTEQAFSQQEAAVPYPASDLRTSLERSNLRERLLRTNNPNAQGYLYLMNYGQIVGYYVIKGKVSSTQSQMTTDTIITDPCGSSYCPIPVTAPGDDGSYGDNESGIFFFTVDGAMVTTNLDYIQSDQPLPIDVPRLDTAD